MATIPPQTQEKPNARISPGVIWIIIGAAMLLLLFGEGLFTYFAIQTINKSVSSRHLEIARRAQSVIAQSLDDSLLQQSQVAESIGQNKTSSADILALALKNNTNFEQISFTDTKGLEIMRQSRLELVTAGNLIDYSKDPSFESALQKNRATNASPFSSNRQPPENQLVGPVFFSDRAEPVILVLTPIYSSEGTFTGMLVVNLNLKFMWNLMAEIRVGQAGRVYVVDNKGNLIADRNPAFVLRGQNLLSRPIVKKIIGGTQIVDGLDPSDRYKNFAGVDVFTTGIALQSFGWGVITEEPLQDALLASQRTLEAGILSSITDIIIFLFLVFALRRLIITAQFLQQERAHTLAVISNLTDGIIEYSANLQIVLINNEAESILGVRKENVLNKALDDFPAFSGQEFQSIRAVFFTPDASLRRKPLLKGSDSFTEEMTIAWPAERTLKVITIPIVDSSGRVISNAKILRDITREKLLERLKSQFISIAAHQLRTPLSAIKWSLRLLLDGDMGVIAPNQRKYLEAEYDTNERMIHLVNDLLDVSRIEEGRFEYTFQEEDVASLTENAIASFKEIAQQRHVALVFEKPKGPLPLISVDREKIEMLLQNLIENALSYTPAGGTVTVALGEEQKNIFIRVSDTGIGIPAKDIPRLFTKFYRAEGAVRMRPAGSGLGLFIAKNIVTNHGGRIDVESQVGKGTSFKILLPQQQSASSAIPWGQD